MTHPLSEPTTAPAFAVIVYADGVCEIKASDWMDKGTVGTVLVQLGNAMLDQANAEGN